MNAIPTNLRPVGMAFESYALYPHFTVFENLANPLRAPGMKHPEASVDERVRRIAKTLRIDHLLERHPGELSGGQKQRVSLGRTMVRDPAVYLLDEPLSHVDAKIRFDLRLEFHRLEALHNRTTIYVTHDYVEALSLGDRLAIIDRGQIIQIGQPREIYYKPRNIFVARLVGQPPINLFDGVLESDRQGARLSVPKGGFKIPISARAFESLERAGVPRELIVGIRPQHIHLASDLERSEARVRSDVFEPSGSFGLLSVIAQEIYLELLVDPEMPFEPDALLGLNFREDLLLFFDPKSQNNVLWKKENEG